MALFSGFNQILDSAIPIPGALAGQQMATGASEICISIETAKPETDAPLYQRTDEALYFNAAKVARYRCRSDSIGIYPFVGSDPAWVSGLLIATALPAAIWMQGRFVLHAAAVVPKGASRAIAFAGASGVGKSMLASFLLERGDSLVADDSVALEVTDIEITASGLPGGVHSRAVNSDVRCFERVALDRSVTSAPLGAIVILDGFAASSEFTPLNKLGAVERIVAHQHRPRIPAILGRIGSVLSQAAHIADRIPVCMWRRRKGDYALSDVEQEMLGAMLQPKVNR